MRLELLVRKKVRIYFIEYVHSFPYNVNDYFALMEKKLKKGELSFYFLFFSARNGFYDFVSAATEKIIGLNLSLHSSECIKRVHIFFKRLVKSGSCGYVSIYIYFWDRIC